MAVYLGNIFLMFLYRILSQRKPSADNDKAFCFLASVNWIVLSGLRHISIGADTGSYQYMFEMVKYKSWNSLFGDFIHYKIKDPGYSIFTKAMQIVTTNYQVYLVIIAVLFMVPFCIWIYKNSTLPFLSFLLYSCLFYSFFSITGIRQTLATALVVIIGYRFVKIRKLIPFLLLMLIAMTIHLSSFCFLPFYFMANKKITQQYITLVVGITFLLFLFKNRMFYILSNLFGYNQYTKYEGAGTWTFTALLLLLLVLVILKRKVIIRNNVQSIHYMNALLFSMFLVPFTFVNPSAMRIVQYYSIFLILLLPEIVKSFQPKEVPLVYVSAASVLLIQLIRNNPVYLFFWQG